MYQNFSRFAKQKILCPHSQYKLLLGIPPATNIFEFFPLVRNKASPSTKVNSQKFSLACQTENSVANESVQTALKIPPSTDIFKYFPPINQDDSTKPNLEVRCQENCSQHVYTGDVKDSAQVPVLSFLRSAVSRVLDP